MTVASAVRNYAQKQLRIGAGGAALLSLFLLLLPPASAWGLLTGYLLSFLFVISNLYVVRRLDLGDPGRFLKVFFTAIAVRFAVVLICFVGVLAFLKIDQILFTVSFIISYIFHSIIEIIFINKILENRHDE